MPASAHCKGQAIPAHAWTGPEAARRLRLPDFMTTAHESGKVVSPTLGQRILHHTVTSFVTFV